MNKPIFVTSEQQNALIIECPEELLGGKEGTEFSSILHSSDQKKVIVDLSKVRIINSTGVGMLVGGFTSCKKNDCELVLAGAGEPITAILKITHLDKVFKMYDSVDEANS
jgi:anti-sigma B factor antagonist